VSALLRRLPRWINRIYARVFGYFWIPCPICGRDFGGHECGKGTLIDPASSTVVVTDDGWFWTPAHEQKLNCWRCQEYVWYENQIRALMILGPERFEDILEGARDLAATKNPPIIPNTAGWTYPRID